MARRFKEENSEWNEFTSDERQGNEEIANAV